jgi:hypothetical protein
VQTVVDRDVDTRLCAATIQFLTAAKLLVPPTSPHGIYLIVTGGPDRVDQIKDLISVTSAATSPATCAASSGVGVDGRSERVARKRGTGRLGIVGHAARCLGWIS